MKYPSFIPKPAEIPGIIPGLLLAIATSVIAMVLAQFIPAIGASPIAIFLGIILGNLYFKQAIFQQGTKFAEGRLLEYAIVLLGFSVTSSTLAPSIIAKSAADNLLFLSIADNKELFLKE